MNESLKVKVLKNIAGNETLLKMPEVLEWISGLGLRVINIRYTRYVKYIEDFYNMDKVDLYTDLGQDKFNKLTKATFECHNIFIIYSVFKNNNSKGFKDRLSMVIKDPDLLEPFKESKARNYLYELLVASYFSLNNYIIDFDSKSDVLATRNGLTFYIECKKVVSKRKLFEKFKRAGKKLNIDVPKCGKAYGLIFIDISSLITDFFPNHEVSDHFEAHQYLTQAMAKLLTPDFNSEVEILNERFKKSSLAVCFMGSGSIWTKEPTQYISTSMNFRVRDSMDDNEFQVLNEAIIGFEGAFEDVFRNINK